METENMNFSLDTSAVFTRLGVWHKTLTLCDTTFVVLMELIYMLITLVVLVAEGSFILI